MIIDCHNHFDGPFAHDGLIANMRRTGSDQINLLMYEQQSTAPDALRNDAAIWLKAKHPDFVSIFGGLDGTGLFNAGPAPDTPFHEQIQNLINCGFDGLKMLLGKPDARKFYGHALDSDVYKPLLNTLESTGFPILWHIADPPEFWSEHTVPPWAKVNRWWYDETFPSKESIDREIANVLNAHPKLNVIFPHFFFLSDRLADAAAVLKRHPNIFFDLAPGVEMLHNFTANHAASRRFFIDHADRIIFGTDIGMANNSTGPERGPMLRRFLETDDRFQVPEDPYMTPDPRPDLHGLKLPQDALDQILYRNFQRVVKADRPRPLNKSAVKKYLQTMESNAKARGATNPMSTQILADLF
ncbi:MAG: amidohydrolase family protein [Phycisphaerales bacterium]|nr:amidohydrolase family protein [Phycisphaerales bacterium]